MHLPIPSSLLRLALLTVGFASAAVQVPLDNGDFKRDLDGWSAAGDNGMSRLASGSDALAVLRVTDDDGKKGSSLVSSTFPAQKGVAYRVRFGARNLSGEGIGVYLQFRDAKGRIFGEKKEEEEVRLKLDPFLLPRDQSAWKDVSLVRTAPEGAVECRIWVHSFIGARVVAEFRNFRVEELTPEEAKADVAAQAASGTSRREGWMDLPAFEKKNPGRAYADLKIYDAKGSALRAPKEDWAGAVERAKSDPKWSTWLGEARSNLDAWIGVSREDVSWVTGWWHQFISPKDGSYLTFNPSVPTKFLSSPTDPQVAVTPPIFGGWVFVFRSRQAGMIREAARLYRLTGETRYAEWAIAQMDFYAENYTNWPLQTSKGHSRLMGQGLDEAVNLGRYLTAARLLEDRIDPAKKKFWIDSLFRPIARLQEAAYQKIHNIGCWHRSATALVAIYADDPALWKSAVEGPNGVRNQVARGVTSDYLWYEQSMGYNLYVVSALAPLFREAWSLGKGESFRAEAEAVENLMLTPLFMRFPNGQIPNPADTTSPSPSRVPNLNFLAEQADLFPTKIGCAQRALLTNWSTLLDPPDQDLPTSVLPEVASQNLETSRMAILKQGPWQVFFHYGQLDASHAQAEGLHYELAFGEVMLSHDPGTVGYGSPLHREFYTRGVRHNVPLLDGKGQESWDLGRLDSFAPDKVKASAPKYRSDATASRSLRIEKGGLVDEVEVKAVDGSEHELGTILHVLGELKIPDEAKDDTGFVATHATDGFQFAKDMRVVSRTDRAVFDVVVGGKSFQIEVAVPGEFRVALLTVPDYPPKRTQALYVFKRGTELGVKTTWRVK